MAIGTTAADNSANDLNAQVLSGATGSKSAPSIDYSRLQSTFRSQSSPSASMSDRLAVDRAEADAIGAQVQMPKLTPPPPPQQPSDPLQAFGQPAMWIAAIGSLFTRHPFATAIQAAGAVLSSTQKLDAQAAQQHMEQWKVQSENAMKLANFQQKAYDAAIKRIDVDAKAGKAELETHIAAFKDEVLQQAYNHGGLAEVKDLLFSRKKAAAKAEANQGALTQHLQDSISVASGLNSDDPKQFADAFEKFNKQELGYGMQGKGAGGEKAKAFADYTSNEMLAQRIRAGDVDALNQAKAKLNLPTTKALGGGKGLTPSMQMEQEVESLKGQHPDWDNGKLIEEAKKRLSASGGADLSDDAIYQAAQRFLDTGEMPALGMGSAGARARIINEAAKISKQNGTTVDDQIQNALNYQGAKAGVRAANTAGARIDIGARELESAIPIAKSASDKVARWGAVPVNKMILALKGQSSDPDLAAFNAANLNIINAFGVVSARGGQSTDAAREHAREVLSTATSKEAYDAVLNQLDREAKTALAASQTAVQDSAARGVPHAAGPRPGAGAYASPDAVKSAMRSGQISKDQAIQILQSQFGFE